MHWLIKLWAESMLIFWRNGESLTVKICWSIFISSLLLRFFFCVCVIILKEAANLGKKVAVLDFVKPSPIGSTWGEQSIVIFILHCNFLLTIFFIFVYLFHDYRCHIMASEPSFTALNESLGPDLNLSNLVLLSSCFCCTQTEVVFLY